MNDHMGREWPPPPAAVGVALTGAALGVVFVFVVVDAGLNRPWLLLPIAVIVLLIAGVRWLAIWRRRERYGEERDAEELPTYDHGRWAEETAPVPQQASVN